MPFLIDSVLNTGCTRSHAVGCRPIGLSSLRTLQNMCFKSTSVTVHTLNFPRMQTGLCISLLHFFIFKTFVPLFAFERSSRAKRRVAPAGMQSAVASLPSLLILANRVHKIHQCYRAYAQLSPNANRSLYFHLAPIHFQNRCPAFSFLREAQNEKANIKSFGKGWRGFRLR